MKATPVLVGAAAVLGLVAFTAPRAPVAQTAVVEVHCPERGQKAFVTPAELHIAVGDSVEWQMAGEVISDSIDISLKDRQRGWPFDGRLTRRGRGRGRARAHRARQRGTYAYNVTLGCPGPDGAVHQVVIDPDIIIE